MTDKEIVSFQANANKISQVDAHPKREAALEILELIEAELTRRVATKEVEGAARKVENAAKRAATLQARKLKAARAAEEAAEAAPRGDSND